MTFCNAKLNYWFFYNDCIMHNIMSVVERESGIVNWLRPAWPGELSSRFDSRVGHGTNNILTVYSLSSFHSIHSVQPAKRWDRLSQMGSNNLDGWLAASSGDWRMETRRCSWRKCGVAPLSWACIWPPDFNRLLEACPLMLLKGQLTSVPYINRSEVRTSKLVLKGKYCKENCALDELMFLGECFYTGQIYLHINVYAALTTYTYWHTSRYYFLSAISQIEQK